MKNFYNEKRQDFLRERVKLLNNKRKEENKAPLNFFRVEDRASSNWNNYQKTLGSINKELKQKPYSPSAHAIEKVENLVAKFNAKVKSEGLNVRPLSKSDILHNAPSWNSIQKTMGAYNQIFKKNATNVVGYNLQGEPIYRFEMKLAEEYIPKLNEQKQTVREKVNFRPEAGALMTTEYWRLQESKNPFELVGLKRQQSSGLHSVIRQVNTNYITRSINQYKENLLNALYNVSDTEIRETLISVLEDMDAVEVYSLSQENPLMSIDYIYDYLNETSEMNQRAAIFLDTLVQRGVSNER